MLTGGNHSSVRQYYCMLKIARFETANNNYTACSLTEMLQFPKIFHT